MTTAPASRAPAQLEGPNGSLAFVTTGSGLPATVFAHGLGGSIETTRPFGSGVRGSRTFFHFRGHGGLAVSDAAETAEPYAALADDLRAVADHVGATQALGVSMGAGALCALLARSPARFARLVFVMPAVLDRPRTDEAGVIGDTFDPDGTHDIHDTHGTDDIHRTDDIHDTGGSSGRLALPGAAPLADRAVLAAVTAPALVIAQEQDLAHPLWVAEQLAASLPGARLVVMPPGGILLRHRAVMRDLIGGFLSGEPKYPTAARRCE